MTRARRFHLAVCVAAIFAGSAVNTDAQENVMLRGFAELGTSSFTAQRTFDALLGDHRGPVFGGGVEAVVMRHLFVNLGASRFRRTGERVFLHNGERFGLGIPVTVTITPLTLVGGYRADFGWRVVPYGGGGIGWHRYEETSSFAETAENARDSFRGYHLVGGAEVRVVRWLGAAVEADWATVPDALGDAPNSVSSEFNDTNLGGTTLRVKVIVGR